MSMVVGWLEGLTSSFMPGEAQATHRSVAKPMAEPFIRMEAGNLETNGWIMGIVISKWKRWPAP